MKPIPGLGKTRSVRIDLGANDVITLPGGRGTLIGCVRGQVWVTREGDSRDYIVPRGLLFVAADAGRIVVNGTMDHNTVEVGCVALARAGALTHQVLQVDGRFFTRIEAEARRARGEHLAALAAAGIAIGRRAWRRVLGWLAGAMTIAGMRTPGRGV
jgi:hypothetical protein